MALLPLLLFRQGSVIDHEFVFVATMKLDRVSVAGTFNGWNKDADALKPSADGMTWTLDLKLKPGRYLYKLVLNGETWITDPKASQSENDGNGNTNSLLILTPDGYEIPAAKGDGVITKSALKHLTEIPFLDFDRGHLRFTLQARPNDIADVRLSIDGAGSLPMSDRGGDEFFERYSADVPWDRKSDVRYRFILNDGAGPVVFGPRGVTSPGVGNDFVLKAATFKPFIVPDWVEKSVIYQIFPDRFANGDKTNDPPNVQPWNARPTYYDYLGGDVAGVEQHLGYLKDLGVSAVYFNPVFKSPSNHWYQTTDYFQIDPIFGTNDEFINLTHDLRRNGIRTVLDGVFNHTATNFAQFADVVKNGADSQFTHWYTFRSFPVVVGRNPNYLTWNNASSMPKLNYANAETRQFMLRVPDFWQSHADIAGWRLDAANEVASDYWQDFRKTVKGIDPNTWIVGEVWGDGSPWLKGDQWDSVMNYQFRDAVLGFVAKAGNGKPSDLMRKLMTIYFSNAPQASRSMMNLIGSHDTERILTLCNGDRSLAKLAAVIQFTWVGAPSIYYGDELGMEGGKDPDNRRGMAWEFATPHNDLLELYRTLIQIRNSNRALQSGEPIPIVSDDAKQVASFARVLDDNADIVVINRSDRDEDIDLSLNTVVGLPKSTITLEFTDALSGKAYVPTDSTLHLRLTPRSAAVLIPRSGSLIHTRRDRRPVRSALSAMSNAIVK